MNAAPYETLSPKPLALRTLRAFVACFTAMGAGMSPASAAPAHAHGVAELRVVVDGGRLEISLESPIDNLIGFEHAPRTDKERTAVRSMATKLRQAQTLFVASAGASCALSSVQLASAVLPADLLGEPKPVRAEGKAEASKDEDGHADLDASFNFQCAAPSLLKGMEVRLLDVFPALRKLNVQVVGPKGQSATSLVPGKRLVNW